MKRILGVVVLILWFAVPAHAQRSGSSFSGGGVAGSLGRVNFPTHSTAPPARFAMRAVKGGPDFVPSSFVSFEDAVAEGRAELATMAKTLGEIARENRMTAKPHARLLLVQDYRGKIVAAQP